MINSLLYISYAFPDEGKRQKCPVAGCSGRVATRTVTRVHFVHGRGLETVVMLELGNFPHLRCARCDLLVPRRVLNWRHPGTSQCNKGAQQKRRRLVEVKSGESMERAFEAYGAPVKNVTEFKYLGRMLTANKNDWLAVVGNLGKPRRSWGRLPWVLGREGADPKLSRAFCTAVTQAVLLFGAESWVLNLRMEKALHSFQARVERKITARQPRQRKDKSLEYPPLVGVLREAGMVGIHTSITRRQNTVAQYNTTWPILDLCEHATRRPGMQVSQL